MNYSHTTFVIVIQNILFSFVFVNLHYQERLHLLKESAFCLHCIHTRGEWPSGLYSLRQVTEVKLGRVRSDFRWVTSEA